MSFTKKQLLPGENLIVFARQHPLVLFKPAFINGIALALLIGLSVYSQQLWLLALYGMPLIYLIWKFLSWRQKEYILTDRRVVLQEGVLSVSSFDASLDKINNVYHNQSFMGRMLNYGDVGLETASESGTTAFEMPSRPVNFKNSIVRQRELYRTDSGRQADISRRISRNCSRSLLLCETGTSLQNPSSRRKRDLSFRKSKALQRKELSGN